MAAWLGAKTLFVDPQARRRRIQLPNQFLKRTWSDCDQIDSHCARANTGSIRPARVHHESKIALGMEGKAHLIPKEKAPVTAEPGLAESRGPGYAKKDLVHQVFGNN